MMIPCILCCPHHIYRYSSVINKFVFSSYPVKRLLSFFKPIMNIPIGTLKICLMKIASTQWKTLTVLLEVLEDNSTLLITFFWFTLVLYLINLFVDGC